MNVYIRLYTALISHTSSSYACIALYASSELPQPELRGPKANNCRLQAGGGGVATDLSLGTLYLLSFLVRLPFPPPPHRTDHGPRDVEPNELGWLIEVESDIVALFGLI
jgi:hypothetical protein